MGRHWVWWCVRVSNGRDGWLWWTDGKPPLRVYHALSLVQFDYGGTTGVSVYLGPVAIHVGFPAKRGGRVAWADAQEVSE